MTDVIVRVPKSEIEHFWEEVPGARIEWWTLGRRPTQFLRGDFVFFAIGDEVVACASGAYHVSGELHSDDGRTWHGEHLVWPVHYFQKFDRPLPLSAIGTQVPRGFAYVKDGTLRQHAAGQLARENPMGDR